MSALSQLASRVFATRNAAHLLHWRTRSHAEHFALGKLYEALPGGIDEIVEKHQGLNGLIDDLDVKSIVIDDVDAMIVHISTERAWIQEHRQKIAGGSTTIENLVDELMGHYCQALFDLQLS